MTFLVGGVTCILPGQRGGSQDLLMDFPVVEVIHALLVQHEQLVGPDGRIPSVKDSSVPSEVSRGPKCHFKCYTTMWKYQWQILYKNYEWVKTNNNIALCSNKFCCAWKDIIYKRIAITIYMHYSQKSCKTLLHNHQNHIQIAKTFSLRKDSIIHYI